MVLQQRAQFGRAIARCGFRCGGHGSILGHPPRHPAHWGMASASREHGRRARMGG
jgi:hypothetical protein